MKPKTCTAAIKEPQHDEFIKMFRAGARLTDMAEHFACSLPSIIRTAKRLGVERDKPARRKHQVPTPKLTPIRRYGDHWEHRITDDPESLTAALCGDPTPQRRELIRSGQI